MLPLPLLNLASAVKVLSLPLLDLVALLLDLVAIPATRFYRTGSAITTTTMRKGPDGYCGFGDGTDQFMAMHGVPVQYFISTDWYRGSILVPRVLVVSYSGSTSCM